MARRPIGALSVDDFVVDTTEVGAPGPGQVLAKTLFVSLDPYLGRSMRVWDEPAVAWRDGAIAGRTIAEVVHSQHPGFAPGDIVLGVGAWQQVDVRDGAALRKLDVSGLRPSAWLGVLGSSGLTAWSGMRKVLAPQAGEIVVISAASGPVGSVAGQLARLAGARVIGIAGGAGKCAYVRDVLGFDACVDHQRDNFHDALRAATPDGIDALFENVGANTLDPVLQGMNKGARVALCGLFQHYQDAQPVCLAHFRLLLDKAIRLQGFHVSDYLAESDAAIGELTGYLRRGELHFRETVTEGLANAPAAYIAMLAGRGMGKHMVQLA